MAESLLSWRELLYISASLLTVGFSLKQIYELYNQESSFNTSKLTSLPPRSRGVTSLIGNTQMVEIPTLSKLTGCKIYAKLELQNPAGSAKDRVALSIVREMERQGKLRPGHPDVILEGTSGSTGISFAVLANSLGYTAHICLPDDTADEKVNLLKSLGATIEPVKPAPIVDPNQYVNVAKRRAEEISNDPNDDRRAIFADQFENDFNWRVHYSTTGPEIWKQMDGDVDVFINGSGTGGTIAGVGKYLKEQKSNVKIILSDPQGSGLANRVNFGVMYDSVEREGTRRRHQVDTLVEGIGLNRLTWNFKIAEESIDEGVRVLDEEALKMAKFLCINDGFFWGSSAAVNCVAAVKTAFKYGPNQKIVVIACDSGSRHLSKFWKRAMDVPNDITLEEIIGDSS